MLKNTTKTMLLVTTFVLPLSVQATQTSSTTTVAPTTTIVTHQANSAAYTLLDTMNMSESYTGMIKRVTQMQIEANPELKAIESTIHAFFDKYMGWEAQKGDIAALYAKNYSTEELQELSKFYQTPLGQKTIQLMPQLAATGAKIGQSKMMQHMPEMKVLIEAELKKLNTKVR